MKPSTLTFWLFCLWSFYFEAKAVKRVDLGCWKDSPRYPVFQSLEKTNDILDDKYWHRKEAIDKCMQAAFTAGYHIFALRNGGECRSGSVMKYSYQKYGKANDCAANGKGGKHSNQVYRITFEATVVVSSLGCWNTNEDGSVPIPLLKNDENITLIETSNVIQKCAEISASYGYEVFGIYNHECYSSLDARSLYPYNDRLVNCSVAGTGSKTGFQAYEINLSAKMNFLGCWRDTPYSHFQVDITESIIGYFSYSCISNRTKVVYSCIGEAKENHVKVTGLEDRPCVMDEDDTIVHHRAITQDCFRIPESESVRDVYEADLLAEQIPLTDLGCWNAINESLISSLKNSHSILQDNYQSRTNAVAKCAQIAYANGYDVIAVTDGGKCLSGYTVRDHYKTNKLSTKCSTNGKGGSGVMQVYELNVMYMTEYNDLGCWYDSSSDRVIPSLEGTSGFLDTSYTGRKNPFQKCIRAAAEIGNDMFALQNGGMCMSSASARQIYRRRGKYGTGSCPGDGEGLSNRNNVYEIKSFTKVSLSSVGCWQDNSSQIIPVLNKESGAYVGHYLSEVETSTNSKIQKCARAAYSRGYTFFTLQNNGAYCMSSRDAGNVYKVLGKSTKCLTTDYGGSLANQVYKINVVNQVRFSSIPCREGHMISYHV